MAAITQVIRFTVRPGYAVDEPPLSQLLNLFFTRQCSYSAYPVTVYSDVTQPSVFYLMSGWHTEQALTHWKECDQREGWSSALEPYIANTMALDLEMEFDRIPKSFSGLVCIVCHRFDDNDSESESSLDLRFQSPFSESEEEEGAIPSPVVWIGGGQEIGSGKHEPAFCQFILYRHGVSLQTIREKLQGKNLIIMCRISLFKASGAQMDATTRIPTDSSLEMILPVSGLVIKIIRLLTWFS
ncbi:hypothetical protein BT96DRAFT_991521 [Gymnopus androsaceus JB14]|uniref:ABM domain-containing protein n=1 Tax=Gymnopus androsaceus JB14 TaxID=1447944 RepID=A0A6A4HVU8_9AGAR|nr:hypothetical protein BT96DRAFT_991521 [Gymnopus androsaceus JB14]